MSINIAGNNNTVVGRDINIQSHVDNRIMELVPLELLKEFLDIHSLITNGSESIEYKKQRIRGFEKSLIKAGATTAVGEIIKYLFTLL